MSKRKVTLDRSFIHSGKIFTPGVHEVDEAVASDLEANMKDNPLQAEGPFMRADGSLTTVTPQSEGTDFVPGVTSPIIDPNNPDVPVDTTGARMINLANPSNLPSASDSIGSTGGADSLQGDGGGSDNLDLTQFDDVPDEVIQQLLKDNEPIIIRMDGFKAPADRKEAITLLVRAGIEPPVDPETGEEKAPKAPKAPKGKHKPH